MTIGPFVAGDVFSLESRCQASLRGRIGYAAWERTLMYVTGGGAWTNERVDDAFTNVRGIAVDASTSSTRTGWTIGTGAEWAFAPNWSATTVWTACVPTQEQVRLCVGARTLPAERNCPEADLHFRI